MMLEREVRGVPVQGASDNATGVAIVMELAQRLSQKPLTQTALGVLFTGAEEVEMVGMMDFMKRHRGELSLEKDFFLNFDSIGDGKFCWITKEGMLRGLPGVGATDQAGGKNFAAGKIRPGIRLSIHGFDAGHPGAEVSGVPGAFLHGLN